MNKARLMSEIVYYGLLKFAALILPPAGLFSVWLTSRPDPFQMALRRDRRRSRTSSRSDG